MPGPQQPPENQPQGKTVRLVNKLPQSLTVTVDGGNGTVREIALAGNGKSDPVQESALTDHTRRLVGRGHVAVRSDA